MIYVKNPEKIDWREKKKKKQKKQKKQWREFCASYECNKRFNIHVTEIPEGKEKVNKIGKSPQRKTKWLKISNFPLNLAVDINLQIQETMWKNKTKQKKTCELQSPGI